MAEFLTKCIKASAKKTKAISIQTENDEIISENSDSDTDVKQAAK